MDDAVPVALIWRVVVKCGGVLCREQVENGSEVACDHCAARVSSPLREFRDVGQVGAEGRARDEGRDGFEED